MAYPSYQPYTGYPPYNPYSQPQNGPGGAAMAGGMSTPLPAQQGFVCRPVTSRAEAEVAQIPFDGSTAMFFDTAADRLYTKTFNFSDGTAPLKTYVPEAPAPAVRYATVEDLEALRDELMKKGKAGKKNEPDE